MVSFFVAAVSPILLSEFVYETAPFPSCHASTLVETNDGLLAAWFGGKAEKDPSVGIWTATLLDGKWSPPVEVANGDQPDGSRLPCWNPVLFQPAQPANAPLLLFYKMGPDPSTWWGLLRQSTDGGKTWSSPRRLPEGVLGPIKNKPIQLKDGTILCPTSFEDSKTKQWRVHFEMTPDLGMTWTKSAPPESTPPINAIQPSILILPNGDLQAVGRTREKFVFSTISQDQGKTWSPLVLTELPNPNSGNDALTLKDGRHLLIYNHTPKGRSPLNLALSSDGKSWANVLTLESEKGEYSYPAIIQTKDGKVHATYTWKREKIRHVIIDPEKFGVDRKSN